MSVDHQGSAREGARQRHTIVASNGTARLHAVAIGQGPVLVLLPGLGRPVSDLEPFASVLADAGFGVVLPDTRGLGASTGSLAEITLHDLAADVAAIVKAGGATSVVLIGHGFGNRVARMTANDWPDLISTVVLLGASGRIQPASEIAEAIRVAQDEATPLEAREAAARRAWFGPDGDPRPWLVGWSRPVIEACLAAAAATPVEEWWIGGRAEILIVQGLLDVSALPENGRLLKEELGGRGTLVELARLGHALPVENARRVADAVIAFLRSPGRASNRGSLAAERS